MSLRQLENVCQSTSAFSTSAWRRQRPDVVALVVVDRRLVAQPAERRVRVGVDADVVGVVVDARVASSDRSDHGDTPSGGQPMRGGHAAVDGITAPVMKLARSEARNAGQLGHLVGLAAPLQRRCPRSSGGTARPAPGPPDISVSMKPGQMVLARMPCVAVLDGRRLGQRDHAGLRHAVDARARRAVDATGRRPVGDRCRRRSGASS